MYVQFTSYVYGNGAGIEENIYLTFLRVYINPNLSSVNEEWRQPILLNSSITVNSKQRRIYYDSEFTILGQIKANKIVIDYETIMFLFPFLGIIYRPTLLF